MTSLFYLTGIFCHFLLAGNGIYVTHSGGRPRKRRKSGRKWQTVGPIKLAPGLFMVMVPVGAWFKT